MTANVSRISPLYESGLDRPGQAARAVVSELTAAESLEGRIALRIAARLSEGANDLPAEISERLRFARSRAVERARSMPAPAADPFARLVGGWLGRRGDDSLLWQRFASVLPLVILIAGMVMIQQIQERQQIDAAAEIDAALLSDDLPPAAYSDPGFAEFIRSGDMP